MVPCGLGYKGRSSVAQGSSSSTGEALPSWKQLLQGALQATKRGRKEALPDQTVHPRHLQAWKWQAVELSKWAEVCFSQPRFGTN